MTVPVVLIVTVVVVGVEAVGLSVSMMVGRKSCRLVVSRKDRCRGYDVARCITFDKEIRLLGFIFAVTFRSATPVLSKLQTPARAGAGPRSVHPHATSRARGIAQQRHRQPRRPASNGPRPPCAQAWRSGPCRCPRRLRHLRLCGHRRRQPGAASQCLCCCTAAVWTRLPLGGVAAGHCGLTEDSAAQSARDGHQLWPTR